MNRTAIIGSGNMPATIPAGAMATVVATEPVRAFDFQNNDLQTMDLLTLKRTHRELNVEGEPLLKVHHFQVIERTAELCGKYGLDYEIEEIFAAQNRNKTAPGVTLSKQLQERFGTNAVEAHILRRVFTTIRIKNFDTPELSHTLALAYHQDGIQAAIGPLVRICHNQCIMHKERMASTYGKDKVSIDQLFDYVIDGWLRNFQSEMSADRARIERLKRTPASREDILTFIGMLSAMRVAHDSKNQNLRGRIATYPLNGTQINKFAEAVLLKMLEIPNLTWWDVYNVATELYKPGFAEIPTLLNQNVAMVEAMGDFIEGRPFIINAAGSDAIDVEYEIVN